MNKAELLNELSKIQKIADRGLEDYLDGLGDFTYSSFSEISNKIEVLKQRLLEEEE